MKTYAKTIMVVDFGLFVELAVTLTKFFERVLYHFPWQASAFPRSNSKMVGKGLHPKLKVVDSLWDFKKDVDLFVFPDVFLGDVQEELESQGKPVFGSRKADETELLRAKAKELFQKLGLPVGAYKEIYGIKELRDYLKSHVNQYVKGTNNRGDFETFHARNYKFVEPKLDELEHVLGFRKKDYPFVVEASIPAVAEIGYDGFCIDGKFPDQALAGIEIKDKGYIGKMVEYDNLPKQVSEFNQKIAPVMARFGCRNFFSTEVRVSSRDNKGYIIDPCVRCGNPPMFTELDFYENLGEIIWEGAHGKVVSPVSKNQWAAQIQISSEWVNTNRLTVQFPEELRQQVKLLNATKADGEYYIIPQDHKLQAVGGVVAHGKTMQEAIKKCKAVAEEIKGFYVECNPESLDEAEQEWAKLSKCGIKL